MRRSIYVVVLFLSVVLGNKVPKDQLFGSRNPDTRKLRSVLRNVLTNDEAFGDKTLEIIKAALFSDLDNEDVTQRDDRDEDDRKIDNILQEIQCRTAGGICTISEDCPAYALAESNLCPFQRPLGIECCYGVSKKEKRCKKRGGACVPTSHFCNPPLIFADAKDCPEDTVCCIMT